MKYIVTAALIVSASAMPAVAQAPANDTLRSLYGRRVQWCEKGAAAWRTGTLARVNGDTLVFSRTRDSVRVPLRSLLTLERSRGRRRLFDALWAAPIGALGGGVAGYMIGDYQSSRQPQGTVVRNLGGALGLVEGAVAGAVIGALVSGVLSPERWTPVVMATRASPRSAFDDCV